MSKKYRFFYHYYRQYNEMTVHFKKICYRTKNINCQVPTETKWNKNQPYLVVQGFCEKLEINEKKNLIIIK